MLLDANRYHTLRLFAPSSNESQIVGEVTFLIERKLSLDFAMSLSRRCWHRLFTRCARHTIQH